MITAHCADSFTANQWIRVDEWPKSSAIPKVITCIRVDRDEVLWQSNNEFMLPTATAKLWGSPRAKKLFRSFGFCFRKFPSPAGFPSYLV